MMQESRRVYRLKRKTRIGFAILGLAVMTSAAALFIFSEETFIKHYLKSDSIPPLAVMIAALGLLIAIIPASRQFMLTADYIQLRTLSLFKRLLYRKDIAGYIPEQNKPGLHSTSNMPLSLVPHENIPNFTLWNIDGDATLDQWCKTLPDYDALRKEALSRMSFARKALIYINPTTVSIFVAFLICNTPASSLPEISQAAFLCMLLLMLFCSYLALRYPTRFSFEGGLSFRTFYLKPENPPRIDLMVSYLCLAYAFNVWAFRSIYVDGVYAISPVKEWFIAPAALTIFFVLFTMFLIPFLRSRKKDFDQFTMILVAFLVLYPNAAMFSAGGNILFDVSAPKTHRTSIQRKPPIQRVSENSFSSAYQLEIKSWFESKLGIKNTPAIEIGVRKDFYNSVRSGDTVCVYEKNGFFGLRWARIDMCTNLPITINDD